MPLRPGSPSRSRCASGESRTVMFSFLLQLGRPCAAGSRRCSSHSRRTRRVVLVRVATPASWGPLVSAAPRHALMAGSEHMPDARQAANRAAETGCRHALPSARAKRAVCEERRQSRKPPGGRPHRSGAFADAITKQRSPTPWPGAELRSWPARGGPALRPGTYVAVGVRPDTLSRSAGPRRQHRRASP